jgi:hypothetical protein
VVVLVGSAVFALGFFAIATIRSRRLLRTLTA